jgi:hypothetical protein
MQRMLFTSDQSLNDAAKRCIAPSCITTPAYIGVVDSTTRLAAFLPHPAEAS